MDALMANVSTACPSAFSGTSGQLFAGAIAAVVAAHCAISAESWPSDQSHDVFGRAAGIQTIFGLLTVYRDGQFTIRKIKDLDEIDGHAFDRVNNAKVCEVGSFQVSILISEGASYDFVVVGAGTAGSLIASRLSSQWSVLLIEAGADPGVDSEIPAYVYNNLNSDIDWTYKTVPDGNSCLGQRDHSCTWSKGKALGGSSSINAMLYIKGHQENYDSWKDLGNTGWAYEDLSLYFDNIESKLNLETYKYNDNPLYTLFEDAYKEIGVPPSRKRDVAVLGTTVIRLLVKNGKRLNTAKMFLNESKHLHIMKNAVVHKVIIDQNTKITAGVEVRLADGAVMQINASKEVILSAGSVGTPQILMLSGVGPKKHLEEKNVKPSTDLPVGQNLQDHVFLPLFLTTKNNVTVTPEMLTLFVMQYLLTKTGPLATIGITDFMAFISTENRNHPNIQFMHIFIPKNDIVSLFTYLNNTGYKAEVIQAIIELNKKYGLIGIYPVLLHPKSKGELLLSDNKPTTKPVIKTNYFQNSEDIEQLKIGINFVMKLQDTKSFQSVDAKLVKMNLPFCSEVSYNTDDYWECYIKHMATTVYHPVGTARMGPAEDASSVVNHQLLVHGVKKLRVVDASIMPDIVGANTMATTLAISEKAFEMIRMEFNLREEL